MLTIKNKKTGKSETIVQHELTTLTWGFAFLVDSELDAYKAAYEYRNNKHGVKIEWAGGAEKWMVIVFNAFAASCGIDGAK